MSSVASDGRGPVSRFFTRLGNTASSLVERFLPNAFIFALLLTFLTMFIAAAVTPSGPVAIVTHWGEGFWEVLAFSMQASLALLTGWALADSPPVKRILKRIAEIPSNQTQAVFVVAVCGQLLGLFHWGVVLIAGAILSREVGIEMAQEDNPVHYPLLVAAAYAGLLPWHQGLSGAALLLSATPGHFAEDTMGIVPVSETIFHPFNLLIVSAVVTVTILIMPLMAPERENITTIPEETLRAARKTATDGGQVENPHRLRETRAKQFLLDSKLVCIGAGLIIWAYLLYLFGTEPFMDVFDINIFISVMFGLGFIAHMTLRSYIEVFEEAIKGASQIIIQFQFYGGIMGIMVFSGLVELIAETAATYATETTWYLFVFISGGIVNFFVPSGGGQWTVMGEIYATSTLGIEGTEMNHMLIAFAMGDQWTNMIQPFWALPVLGIAGLSIRDMMGYVSVLFIFSGIVMGIGAIMIGVLG